MGKTKKVLVIGANGFIGSHIVDMLANAGYEVRAFDRYSTSVKFNANSLISRVKGDIFDENDIAGALDGIDYVMHCFSATTPYSADLNPYSDINKNILNNAKIFETCAKQNVKKIIYISSGGAIYGASAENGKSAKETDVALPISPYGISKLATERYLEYFKRKYGTEHVSYRLSNPYGPRQVTKHNQGVVPRFIENISTGKKISVYGDGSSSRDYIYIEDAAKFIVDSFVNCKQQLYNVGSGEQTSLIELISTLEELLNKTANVEKLPEPQSFAHSTQLDVSRFSEEFGIKPDISFTVGLAKTIEQLNTPIN